MQKNITLFWKASLCLLSSVLIFKSTIAQSINATCNSYSPLVVTSFSAVSVTSSTTVGFNDFVPSSNLVDANLTNFATWNYLIGSSAYIEVKDNNATGSNEYGSGSYAGFVIDNSNLATLLGNVTVTTYLGAVQQEFVTGTSLLSSSLLGGKSRIGFVTNLNFDRIRISFNGLSVAGSVNVYYAEVHKFCAGLSLTCNTATTLIKPAYPVFIDPINTGIAGVACVLCAVNNAENVIDNNPLNFAQIIVTAGVAATGNLAVSDQISTYASGTYAGFDMETVSLLNANVLGNITISLLNNGTVVQTGTGSSQLITVGTSLLSGTPRSIIGIVSNVSFDEVKITLANTAGLDIGSTNIYGAIFQKGCAGTIGCSNTFFLNNPAYPVVIEGSRTGINTIACVACTVNNSQNVISASNTDFSRIDLTAGVFASGSISVRDLSTVYPAGTTTGFTVEDPNNFIQATLFNSITITTYLNGIQQETKTGTQLISVAAIVAFINPANNIFNVGFTSNLPWNEVRITYSNVGGALTFLNVFSAFVDTRFVPQGTPGFSCNYTNPDMNVTYVNVAVNGNVSTNDKIQSGTTYGAPVLHAGITNPSVTLPIVNANGTYIFTPTAIGVYQFIVPVCLLGNCKDELLIITVLDSILGANNPPVANTDIAITKTNVAVTIKSLVNDAPGKPSASLVTASVTLTDLNGIKIGITSFGGTATVNNSNGDITYTPAAGFIGIDTVRYTVCDNQAPTLCANAYQIITVITSSAPPTTAAADDYSTTPKDIPVNGNVSINDINSAGITQVVQTQNITTVHGTFVLNANGDFTFSPAIGFTGSVDFPYNSCDLNNATSCSNATLHILVQSASAVLPVIISNFNALSVNCDVNILWKSETELNLQNYTVEYSKDGIVYSAVFTINGKGSGSEYNYLHTPASGKVFYRLKSVDLDGKIQYSKIIIIKVDCSKNSVFVYPNPASEILNINIAGRPSEIIEGILYDPSGRRVLNQYLKNGINLIKIHGLSKGNYILHLVGASGVDNIQVMIQ